MRGDQTWSQIKINEQKYKQKKISNEIDVYG